MPEGVLFSRLFEGLLSVVSKDFEKLLNNRIVDHLGKCGLFSDFQYGFRSSRSITNVLTVVSDRIARTSNRSGATQAVALNIFKACCSSSQTYVLWNFRSDVWLDFFSSQ